LLSSGSTKMMAPAIATLARSERVAVADGDATRITRVAGLVIGSFIY
jgi:hypothetical protein